MPNRKTKVGDRIRVTKVWSGNKNHLVGKELIVKDTRHSLDGQRVYGDGFQLFENLGDDWEVMETPSEDQTFKVGDRARVTGGTDYHNYDIGALVAIIGISLYNIECKKISGGGVDYNQFINREDLELVEEGAQPVTTGKAQVGSRVRVVKERDGRREGEIGTVEDYAAIDLDGEWMSIVFSDEGVLYLNTNIGDRYELVTDEQEPEQQSPSEDMTPPGTLAKVTLENGKVDYINISDIQTGDLYEHTFTVLEMDTAIRDGDTTNNNTNMKGKTIMQKLSLIARKTFDKDTKTLIKAGVLDNNLQVVDRQFVLDFIASQHTKELAAVAQERLDEAKEDCDC